MAQTLSEHGEQTAFVEWAQLMVNRGVYPELRWLFAIVNERGKGKSRSSKIGQMIEIQKAIAQGLKPGVPDLCLPVAHGGYFGLWLETKVKPNRPTAAQKEWLEYLNSAGYLARVCFNYSGLREAVEEYLAMPPTIPAIAYKKEPAD